MKNNIFNSSMRTSKDDMSENSKEKLDTFFIQSHISHPQESAAAKDIISSSVDSNFNDTNAKSDGDLISAERKSFSNDSSFYSTHDIESNFRRGSESQVFSPINSSEEAFGKIHRCYSSSILATPMREPIAPGIYTRVRKRSSSLAVWKAEMLNQLERRKKEAILAEVGTNADSEISYRQPSYSSYSPTSSDDPSITKIAPMSEKASSGPIKPNRTDIGLPIIQEFILDSQFRITIEGRKKNSLKLNLFVIGCIFSFGLLYLLYKWFPKLASILTTTQSTLATSTHIYILNSYNQDSLVPVKRNYFGKNLQEIFENQIVREKVVVEEFFEKSFPNNAPTHADIVDKPPLVLSVIEKDTVADFGHIDESTNGDSLRQLDYPTIHFDHVSVDDASSFSSSIFYKRTGRVPMDSEFLYSFEYRNIRFIYHPNTGRYFENSQWEAFQQIDFKMLHQGISQSLSNQRKIVFGLNEIKIEKKSIPRLLIDEILHPFNVFQLFSIAIWIWDEYYYYAGAIIFISLLTISATIFQTLRNIDNMIKMSVLHGRVNICRDGQWSHSDVACLVPGDLFAFDMSMTDTLPCDALLLEGDCIVNESMVSGESIPVSKCPIEEDLWLANGMNDHSKAISSTKSFLFAGTKLIRVRNFDGRPAKAVVINTGFNTTKGLLMRNILFPRPINFKFYQDAMRFIAVFAAIAFMGFIMTFVNFILWGVDKVIVAKRSFDLITIAIPPALPLSMAIGISFAINRLRARNIFCISPAKINIAGKLNMFCFDKTGTLTEEGLDVLGVLPVKDAEFSLGDLGKSSLVKDLNTKISSLIETNQTLEISSLSPDQNMILAMASCHSVKYVDGKCIGDPLDVRMFEFTGWELEEPDHGNLMATIVRPPISCQTVYSENSESNNKLKGLQRRPENIMESSSHAENSRQIFTSGTGIGIVRVFEFVASLRRMTVLAKAFSTSFLTAFVKGAPESIREICTSGLPSDFDSVLDYYTVQGYRVIAVAMRSFPNLSSSEAQKIPRKDVECSLRFLGFIIFENRLIPVSKNVIVQLQQANFRTLIVTGDNILTAISVAKDCRIIEESAEVFIPKFSSINDPSHSYLLEGENKLIWPSVSDSSHILSPTTLTLTCPGSYLSKSNYTVACTGEVFEYLIDSCSLEVLNNVLMRCQIFSRMSPEQKQRLVECLQRIDYCVGFCGDGANDCCALKAADVGLSLSEAEASVAAPFTSKVRDIRCTLDLICQGRSALASSFSCFRFMAIYALIQFSATTLQYVDTANMSDKQFVFADLMIVLPTVICISRLVSSDKITRKRPTAKLMSKGILIPLIGQITLAVTFLVGMFFLTKSQPWYVPVPFSPVMTVHNCHLNAAMFNTANFLYLVVAYIFSLNTPFHRPIYQQSVFVAVTSLILFNCLYVLFYPWDGLRAFLKLIVLPMAYKKFILVWVCLHATIALFAHFYIFPLIIWILKRHRKGRKRVKLYKKLSILLKADERNV